MTRRGFSRAAVASGVALGGILCGGWGFASSWASSPKADYQDQITETLFVFDTVVTLTASCSRETMDELVNRCAYFESKLSRTISSSDVGRINAAAGAPVDVSRETAELIKLSLAYCERSAGAFDITIGAVSELWDFKAGVVPDSEALAEALPHVDYRNVQVEGDTVTLLDPDAKLDLGGIAKGYIADDLCRMLDESGCSSAFVNLGGNVKTLGTRPDGRAWHVGVQDPRGESGDVIAFLSADPAGMSVVTSGLYERQFEKDGTRYWHILNPHTGYPMQTDIASATIVSSASIDGDGLTKPLFSMGFDDAITWMEETECVEGVLVSADGTIAQTSACGAELVQ